jgi:hypothetical protein
MKILIAEDYRMKTYIKKDKVIATFPLSEATLEFHVSSNLDKSLFPDSLLLISSQFIKDVSMSIPVDIDACRPAIILAFVDVVEPVFQFSLSLTLISISKI